MEIPKVVERFVETVAKKYSPNFAIKNKSTPTGLYKIVAEVIRVFNKDIDSRYITTLLGECWVPSNFFMRPTENSLAVLAHEVLHEYDRKRMGSVPFVFLYLFPQILSVLSLLSFLAIGFGPWWLLSLLFLLFLLPIPSPGRMWLELRGYRVDLMINKHVHNYSNEALDEQAEKFATYFIGGDYYWMWPFKKHIVSLLKKKDTDAEIIYVELLNFFINEAFVQRNAWVPYPLPADLLKEFQDRSLETEVRDSDISEVSPPKTS